MSESPVEGRIVDSGSQALPAPDSQGDTASGGVVRRKRRLGSAQSGPSKLPESGAGNQAETNTEPSTGDAAPKKRTRRVVAKSSDTTDSADREAVEPRRGPSGGPKITRTRKHSSQKSNGSPEPKVAARDKDSDASPNESPAATEPMTPMPPSRPRIGDSRPAPATSGEPKRSHPAGRRGAESPGEGPKRRRRGGRGRGRGKPRPDGDGRSNQTQSGRDQSSRQHRQATPAPVEFKTTDEKPLELADHEMKRQRGKQRKGRPVGRYQMVVHVHGELTHIAILEGRSLIEYYVSRPSDDVAQIHGNIYIGKVQNVLPGMEAAFVDIGTPKNAVLYRGDVTFDNDDIEQTGTPAEKTKASGQRRNRKDGPRIEQLLKVRQSIVCQVTKNPIGHKGARLTTDVSLPGRFVVLVPNSQTYGISKRLQDKERKRLRGILDKVKPPEHGLIVRTAAEHVTAEEISRDVARLVEQCDQIDRLAKSTKKPTLLFREPELAVRVIREEFTRDYRGVIIDDRALYEQVKGYMETVTPALADRIEYYDTTAEVMPVFERHHIEEQLRKAVDRKVWLPSGGSLIIEHTEALSVIDVNTGKNVGKSSLEETVFRNNLEAADEIAKQLRLRDIGGIIVIDFIDMEVRSHRDEVMRVFQEALARDKTRTQAFDITDLGLVEMTRKRIGEGLLVSVSTPCVHCEARGVQLDEALLG